MSLRGWLVAVGVAVVAPASAQTITPRAWPVPLYPQVAQSARIHGDVEVAIDVRPDGTVADVQVVKGPPLVRDAVVDAARAATFECRGCTAPATTYSLYVTFRLLDSIEGVANVPPLVVSPTQGWITVDSADRGQILCILYAWVRVRGPRCLYLWRCETEWGGMQTWHERVHSKRCLWLWPCGWSRAPVAAPE
jgi:TonB family protein